MSAWSLLQRLIKYFVNLTFVEAPVEIVYDLTRKFRHIYHCQKTRDAVFHWEAVDLLENLNPVFEVIVSQNASQEFTNLSRRERELYIGARIQVLFHN